MTAIECGLRRKAKPERGTGKAEASILPHPSTFAFFLFAFFILIPDRSAFGVRGGHDP